VGARATPARLLTAREVAECLAVCIATVYALCERGEIRHLRVSNTIRVRVLRGAAAHLAGGVDRARPGTHRHVSAVAVMAR